MRNRYRAVVVLCAFILAVSTLSEPLRAGQVVVEQLAQTVTEKSESQRKWEREQEKAKNKHRHEDLKKDTDKLLQLATDLKLAVDRSNEQTLSMEVIKKADEIEKLAKNIQRKMKGD